MRVEVSKVQAFSSSAREQPAVYLRGSASGVERWRVKRTQWNIIYMSRTWASSVDSHVAWGRSLLLRGPQSSIGPGTCA